MFLMMRSKCTFSPSALSRGRNDSPAGTDTQRRKLIIQYLTGTGKTRSTQPRSSFSLNPDTNLCFAGLSINIPLPARSHQTPDSISRARQCTATSRDKHNSQCHDANMGICRDPETHCMVKLIILISQYWWGDNTSQNFSFLPELDILAAWRHSA